MTSKRNDQPEQRPPAAIKGRGALSNPTNRFQPTESISVDDGWTDQHAEAPRPETRLLTDKGRTIQASAPEVIACMIEGTGMPPADLEELVASLTLLTNNLQNAKNGAG